MIEFGEKITPADIMPINSDTSVPRRTILRLARAKLVEPPSRDVFRDLNWEFYTQEATRTKTIAQTPKHHISNKALVNINLAIFAVLELINFANSSPKIPPRPTPTPRPTEIVKEQKSDPDRQPFHIFPSPHS